MFGYKYLGRNNSHPAHTYASDAWLKMKGREYYGEGVGSRKSNSSEYILINK